MTDPLDPSRKVELALEGARLRAASRPKDACPYPADSPERVAWMEGYEGEPANEAPDLPMDQS